MRADSRINEKSIWRFLNGLLLSCIGLFGGGRLLGIDGVKPAHFLTVITVLVLFTFLNNASARGRVMGGAFGVICLLGAGAFTGVRDYGAFIKSYLLWLWGSFPWREEWTAGYEGLQVIFLAIACYLIQILMEKSIKIKITIVILTVSGLLYCLFSERELSHMAVAFALCYIAMVWAEWTEGRWKKEKRKGIHSYMLWIAPFLGVYFLMMALTPVPKTPYRWQFVRNIYEQLRESFLEISQNIARKGQEDYDLSLSGFSEKGELTGTHNRDDREIMTIESSAPLTTNLYLTGKIYDTFDGRQWLKTGADTVKERLADTAQTLCAVAAYEENYQQDYLLRARITVSYRYFHTRFLFAPLKIWEMKQQGNRISFHENGDGLLFEQAEGYGTEYEAAYYQMNAGEPAFYRFLEEEAALDEGRLEKILKDLRSVTGEDIRTEDLKEYQKRVYDTYLSEVTLSDDVQKALSEMTQGAETEVGKLRAVEAALSSLHYTRSPGELPEWVLGEDDFLDYFLLKSGQGYCNYFATAFVLLARAQGIPARYVQGFCVPMKDKKEATVYAYMAHAWPEVYLDGIGWIPFEPTPGFAESRYTPWGLKGDKSGISGSEDFQVKWQPKEDGGSETELLNEAAEDFASGPEDFRTGRLFRIAGLSLLTVFLLGILILTGDYLLDRYRYRKMNDGEKLNADLRKFIRALAIMGIKREEGETLAEFAERSAEVLEKKDIMGFIDLYEGYLYGNQEITPENVEEVKGKLDELMTLLWERNKFGYLRSKLL